MYFDFYTLAFKESTTDCDKPAVWGSNGSLSWSEFEACVKELKATLQSNEIAAGQPVIIYGHKETYYPVAIIALMSLNIPYIPVDTIYPAVRIESIIRQTGSCMIINCGNNPLPVAIPMELYFEDNIRIRRNGIAPVTVMAQSDDPVRYIMFTSGSTGEPKGVQITRNAIHSFLNWAQSDFGFNTSDVFLNQSPFTFDVSLFDILISFQYGASVFLVNRACTTGVKSFFETMKQRGITVWTSTPAFVYMFLREKEFNCDYFPTLKTFVFAGEILPVNTVRILRKNFPDARIINAYGPTEATIITTWCEVTDNMMNQPGPLPIGYPKKGANIFTIPDDCSSESPGEIIIAGAHVSSGYYKNSELSAEKFFTHLNMSAFRTGDLGYFQNGLLFFAGRNDDQIKLHGYRIELSEIDSIIAGLNKVETSVTVPVTINREVKRLISFIVLLPEFRSLANETIIGIKDQIRHLLPSYMIPGEIVSVEKIPVSANFKVDKNALLEYYKSI